MTKHIKLEAGATSAHEKSLDEHMSSWMSSVVKRLSERAGDPDQASKVIGEVLDESEYKRFVLTNLLESLKRGGSLSNTLSTYKKVGFFQIPGEDRERQEAPSEPTPDEERERQEPTGEPTTREAQFLLKLIRKVARFLKTLIKVVLTTLQELLKNSSVEIKPVIGTAGLFPTLAFTFDLAAEAKLNDVWKVLDTMGGGSPA